MPDTIELSKIEAIEHLSQGAENIVVAGLSVSDRDSVTLICDESSQKIAAALLNVLQSTGAQCSSFIVEQHTTRPMAKLPVDIVRSLEKSTVSIYTVHPQPNEYSHRKQLIDMVKPLNLKHAHMIRITEDAMMQGVLADYHRVARLNKLMIDRINAAGSIRVSSRAGTDLQVTLDPSEPWDSSAGVVEPGNWYNFPNGEVLTSPSSIDGIYVCNGIAPSENEYSSSTMAGHPLSLEFKNGLLVNASGGPGQLANEVTSIAKSELNMNRVGMFAVGTNFELLMPIGDPIQDLFIPGAYFGLGRLGSPKERWSTSRSLPFTSRRSSLHLDGVPVIDMGKYDPALLDQVNR